MSRRPFVKAGLAAELLVVLVASPSMDRGILAGEVFAPDGRPVTNTDVCLRNLRFYHRSATAHTLAWTGEFLIASEVQATQVKTDDHGWFILPLTSVPPSPPIETMAAGVPRLLFLVSAWAPGIGVSPPVEVLVEPASREEVRFELGPAVAVEGRVVDVRGAPVPGARVELSTAAPVFMSGIADWDLVLQSGADGTFQFDGLVPGEYHLSVTMAGFIQLFAGSDPVIPHGTARQEVRMAKDAPVRGRVLDAHGEPVRNAQLTYESPSVDGPFETDGEGRFSLPLGEFTVRLPHGEPPRLPERLHVLVLAPTAEERRTGRFPNLAGELILDLVRELPAESQVRLSELPPP